MGGIVALEMAHQFRAQGQRVALLALLDTRIPSNDRRSTTRTSKRGCWSILFAISVFHWTREMPSLAFQSTSCSRSCLSTPKEQA